MRELSEEEIMKNLKKIIDTDNCWLEDKESADEDMIEWAELEKSAIQGLLDLYQKEKELSLKRFKNLVKIQEEKDKIYNEGYLQGVKDERNNTEEHIRERIEELNTERINFENDNPNRIFMREFINKYAEKDANNFGVFNTQEVITYMTNNEYIARISELQELLAPKLLEERN